MQHIQICVQNVLQQFGDNMCWMCGCADHIGLGNERDSDTEKEDGIIVK